MDSKPNVHTFLAQKQYLYHEGVTFSPNYRTEEEIEGNWDKKKEVFPIFDEFEINGGYLLLYNR